MYVSHPLFPSPNKMKVYKGLEPITTYLERNGAGTTKKAIDRDTKPQRKQSFEIQRLKRESGLVSDH